MITLSTKDARKFQLGLGNDEEEELLLGKCSFKKRRMFLIRVNDRFRTLWDIIIIVMSLYNCFVLPVDIAFKPSALESEVIDVFNVIIDIIFAIDIFLNFRTTIANDLTGDEITDGPVIAKTYLKHRFFLDLLATIPFD